MLAFQKIDQHGGARTFRSICTAPIRHVIKLSEPRPYQRVSLATRSSASVAYISASAARSFVVKGSLIPRGETMAMRSFVSKLRGSQYPHHHQPHTLRQYRLRTRRAFARGTATLQQP